MNRKCSRQTLLSLLIVGLALPVQAHTGHSEGASLQQGLLHPLAGIDHLLALLAVAAWTVHGGRRRHWLMPLVFSAGLMAGSLLVLSGMVLPVVELLIALSIPVLGGLIYFNPKLMPLLAGWLMVGFALLHGYAHTSAAASEAALGMYLGGILAGNMAILYAGIGMAHLMKRAHSASLRWSGVGFSFAGLLLLTGL